MTSKEAVDLFKQYYWKVEDKEKALEILEELAERDTPDKPLLVETSTDNVHHYECLYCGATINIGGSISYNKAFNIFCRKCGQRLDWSE